MGEERKRVRENVGLRRGGREFYFLFLIRDLLKSHVGEVLKNNKILVV